MTAAPDELDALRKRFGFDDWAEPAAADEALFLWRFFFAGYELRRRRALRIDSVAAPGWPPGVQSLWRAAEEAEGQLVRVDVYESGSALEAREFLLRHLGQFQSPLIERRRADLGDLSFGMPGGNSVLFVRANVVVVVRNAGDEVEPVEPVAREVDQLFAAPPTSDRSAVRPTISAEIRGTPAMGDPVPIDLEAQDPLGRRVWFRLSSKSGVFSAREGSVFYTPAAEGKQSVEVAAVNENLGVAVETLEFEVGTLELES